MSFGTTRAPRAAGDEFTKKLPSIAELAVGDACTGSNPRPITPKEMATLMSCTYYGKEVDF